MANRDKEVPTLKTPHLKAKIHNARTEAQSTHTHTLSPWIAYELGMLLGQRFVGKPCCWQGVSD